MKKINLFKITRLLAATSLGFHSSAYNIIAMFGGIVGVLGSLMDEYGEAIELQKRASNKRRGLANTHAINEKDKVRDAFLNRFFKLVSDFARSPVAGEKATAQVVNDAVLRFRGLMGYERNKQTGEIGSMMLSLHQPAVWDALCVLRLDHIVEQIEAANADFEAEMNIRIEIESQKEKLVAAKQRKATEAIYTQIVQKINAISILQPTTETNDCINHLNALIKEFSRVIANMRAGGSGNEKRKKKETPDNES